jgi:glycolate oxidase iron-sulfur subunit
MKDSLVAQNKIDLLSLTDQCVMCGLCAPQCPTYRLDHQEAESPRGRIALARNLANGKLELTPATLGHLDHCLGCRSCEKVCPSQVRYGDILDKTRALTAACFPRDSFAETLSRPRLVHRLAKVAASSRASQWLPSIAGIFPRSSRWRRAAVEVPRTAPSARQPRNLTRQATRGRVMLFTGCVASVFDRDTLDAAQYLLESIGFEVVRSAAGICCGALPAHAGNVMESHHNAAQLQDVVGRENVSAVLVCASGCLGSLRDEALSGTQVRVADIIDFLAEDFEFTERIFRPVTARAALHLPCSQLNVGSGGGNMRKLLSRVPDLEILALPEQPRCCGAAGSYFLTQPDRADALRNERLESIVKAAPDMLLTTNIGCRIFLDNGLRQRDSQLPVRHPLTLLAEQLESVSP